MRECKGLLAFLKNVERQKKEKYYYCDNSECEPEPVEIEDKYGNIYLVDERLIKVESP
jgi:hypothetical protein